MVSSSHINKYIQHNTTKQHRHLLLLVLSCLGSSTTLYHCRSGTHFRKELNQASRPKMDYTKLSLFVLIFAAFYGIYTVLEANLENFYIFNPAQLHKIALSAIDQHGNNTQAIVSSIISELSAIDSVKPHLNFEQEWIFNNAGGAMGAMYIIHASKSSPTFLKTAFPLTSRFF